MLRLKCSTSKNRFVSNFHSYFLFCSWRTRVTTRIGMDFFRDIRCLSLVFPNTESSGLYFNIWPLSSYPNSSWVIAVMNLNFNEHQKGMNRLQYEIGYGFSPLHGLARVFSNLETLPITECYLKKLTGFSENDMGEKLRVFNRNQHLV